MPAVEAIRLIKNGVTVTTGGFCGAGVAEDIVLALEKAVS